MNVVADRAPETCSGHRCPDDYVEDESVSKPISSRTGKNWHGLRSPPAGSGGPVFQNCGQYDP